MYVILVKEEYMQSQHIFQKVSNCVMKLSSSYKEQLSP